MPVFSAHRGPRVLYRIVPTQGLGIVEMELKGRNSRDTSQNGLRVFDHKDRLGGLRL